MITLHDMHDTTYTNVYMIVLWCEKYVEPWCPVQILWKWVETCAETEFAIDPSCHDGPCKDYNLLLHCSTLGIGIFTVCTVLHWLKK